jgi:hypothetical protein
MDRNANTQFICLLVDESVIFTEWSISEPAWEKQKSVSVIDYSGEPFLFLEMWTSDDGRAAMCAEYPVYGRENRWHVFVTRELAGKRIRACLCCESIHGYRVIIAESGELDVPLSGQALSDSLDRNGAKELFRISGAAGELDGSSSSS